MRDKHGNAGTTRFVHFIGHDEGMRPFAAPLGHPDPLRAYAPFAHETRAAAVSACAVNLARFWLEVATDGSAAEGELLDHHVIRCRILPDGRILGGRLEASFPSLDGDWIGSEWNVHMSRREVEELTREDLRFDGFARTGWDA